MHLFYVFPFIIIAFSFICGGSSLHDYYIRALVQYVLSWNYGVVSLVIKNLLWLVCVFLTSFFSDFVTHEVCYEFFSFHRSTLLCCFLFVGCCSDVRRRLSTRVCCECFFFQFSFSITLCSFLHSSALVNNVIRFFTMIFEFRFMFTNYLFRCFFS